MKTKLTGRLLLAIACSLLLYSCQKESSTDQPAVTSEEAKLYADESAQADAAFEDVEDISMIAAEEEAIASEGGRGTIIFPFAELRLRLGPCADITVNPNDGTYPKTSGGAIYLQSPSVINSGLLGVRYYGGQL